LNVGAEKSPTYATEVDFLVRPPGAQTELVQVCADASSPETLARELRALEEAGHTYPEAKQRLFVLTSDGLPRDLPAEVVCQTAYEWMLQ
jgi:hypothetical protein